MRLGLAFRAFFGALFSSDKATAIDHALADPNSVSKKITTHTPDSSGPKPIEQNVAPKALDLVSARSEALTMLSILQREARLIDLVYEPLNQYSDAQVGAAAREVLQQTQKALHRMFEIEPLSPHAEGAQIDLPAKLTPARWTVIGDVKSKAKVTVVHPGWVAKAAHLPVWNGAAEDRFVLMPTEIE